MFILTNACHSLLKSESHSYCEVQGLLIAGIHAHDGDDIQYVGLNAMNPLHS